MKTIIHPTAEIESDVLIGKGCQIWQYAHVREHARLGNQCKVGRFAFIDHEVMIGHHCKIQNHASLFHGAFLEDGVFIGPYACLTNDKHPRAVNPDLSLKAVADWQVSPTKVLTGASIGAHVVILPGVTVGKWAMVGAGSVVTKDIPDYALVVGNPGRVIGAVDERGFKK